MCFSPNLKHFFKNEAGYLNLLSSKIFLMILDLDLPGAHKNIDLLLFKHFKDNVILKKSLLLTKITFLLNYLLIFFLNSEAI